MPATWICWQILLGHQQQPLTAMAITSMVDSRASLVDSRQRPSRLGLLAVSKEGSLEVSRGLSMDRQGNLVQPLSLQASPSLLPLNVRGFFDWCSRVLVFLQEQQLGTVE